MEEFIDFNYKRIFEQMRALDSASQYAACNKFLDLIRPYFCQFILSAKEKFFFRVRSHPQIDPHFYFTNISELTYRTDLFNINTFGRCNCPFESLFYCADHPILSFLEVTKLSKLESKNKSLYHTTSIWKLSQKLSLTPIFEKQTKIYRNEKLVQVTNSCLDLINKIENYNKKEELKEFHRIVGKEFIKDFSLDKDVYLLSAAISNYLLNHENLENIKIDGIMYPTCIRQNAIRNLGVNYAFNPCIIGFGKKIELVSVCRSKVEKRKRGYYQTELQQCKKINTITGEIVW